MNKKMAQLPAWLWPSSNVLSPLYKKIWEAVQEDRSKTAQGEPLVDTNKVFPLLLTSQLPTEVLGYIWSLANQKYAGQLTEQELYVVLALVALAQASYPFNSLEVLNYIRIPPTPNINLTLLDSMGAKNESKPHVTALDSPPSNSLATNKKHGSLAKSMSKTIHLSPSADNSSYNHNQPDLREVRFSSGHSPNNTSTGFTDSRQNFYSQTDVKQQPSSCITDNDEFSDFQSAPIINVPNIPNMWDSKQGSAIGSRLANHNLGVKKLSDKLKKTSVSRNSNSNQIRSTGNANPIPHSKEMQSNERLSELFPKCSIKSQPKTFILKDTIIRHNDSVEVVKTNAKDFTSISDKTLTNKTSPPLTKSPHTKTTDSIYVAPLKETKDNVLQQDLMSLVPAEDKYSALRALVDETPSVVSQKLNIDTLSTSPVVDDFGDFVSAEQLESAPVFDHSNTVQNSVDLLSDFDFNTESIIGLTNASSPSLIQEISDAFNALAFEESLDRQNEEKIDVTVETEKIIKKEDTISVNSVESGPPVASGVLTRSGSVPSLDLKSFLPSSQDDEQQIENMHQTIYWEWKQYMESCVLLLQIAADIFTSITSEMVLKEVLSSAQGYNFLCNLAEVAAVCRRVNFSHKEMDINIMGFDDLLMDIDRIWSEMEPFYTNIPIITELPAWPLHPGDGVTCALCLTVITSGRVIWNDNNYHATCANLWLHTVNSSLPVLRYPISFIQTSIPQSVNHA